MTILPQERDPPTHIDEAGDEWLIADGEDPEEVMWHEPEVRIVAAEDIPASTQVRIVEPPEARARRIYLDPMDDAPEDEWIDLNPENQPYDGRIHYQEGMEVEDVRVNGEHIAVRRQDVPRFRHEMELERIDQQLEQIYGALSKGRSDRARVQSRDSKGRFSTRGQLGGDARSAKRRARFTDENGRLRNGLGQFAKPRGFAMAMQQFGTAATAAANTIRVYQTEWNRVYPNFTWEPTGTPITINMPVTYTNTANVTGTVNYTTTGGMNMARAWRDEVRGMTYIEDDNGFTFPVRDEEFRVDPIIWQVRERDDALWEAEHRRMQTLRDYEQQHRQEESRRELAKSQRTQGAQEKALRLFKYILNPEELLLWETTGKVHVRGSDGGLYEIDTRHHGVHGNVWSVDEHGCRLGNLCVAPRMFEDDPELGRLGLPLADGWIGQYLTIKNNEADLLRHANWSQRQRCIRPNIPILPAFANAG